MPSSKNSPVRPALCPTDSKLAEFMREVQRHNENIAQRAKALLLKQKQVQGACERRRSFLEAIASDYRSLHYPQ
jgi:hypothetical protein